jgi:hypothetical protein
MLKYLKENMDKELQANGEIDEQNENINKERRFKKKIQRHYKAEKYS